MWEIAALWAAISPGFHRMTTSSDLNKAKSILLNSISRELGPKRLGVQSSSSRLKVNKGHILCDTGKHNSRSVGSFLLI
jgi:hypothetical protein